MAGSRWSLKNDEHASLKDKVVVLTGGANGIGAALVRQLHALGAPVVFGDVDPRAGQALVASLTPSSSLSDDDDDGADDDDDGSADAAPVTFVRCDTSVYADVVALFAAARAQHGRVDHAVACAGVLEAGRADDGDQWFGAREALTVEQVAKVPPCERTLDVNLRGSMYFARVAAAHLADDGGEGGAKEDRSLTLVSSAAGFREAPGLPAYQVTKHGIMGLMRNLRSSLHANTGVRVNAVLPAMTETAMVGPAAAAFRAGGCAVNMPDDVALYMVDVMARSERDAGKPLNGLSVYVEGARGWEIEEGLRETMPLWLGEEPVARIADDDKFVSASMWK